MKEKEGQRGALSQDGEKRDQKWDSKSSVKEVVGRQGLRR